ncbi:uncharacterized protein PFLUO_LOCUS4508 [Penicillium psychrofluorescens]|uniref:uncharacterized protein n=1 Tax=Penicillium psychrofluorescens TaxID=3158075 RepID=UPI003CCD8040
MPPKSKSKKAATTPQTQKQPPNANAAPPNWPPLRPLLPPTDLTLTPLVTDQIYLIRNFLPGTLCKNYVSFLASLPLTTTPGKPKKDEAVRVNDRFQIEDARFAEMLWGETALRELVVERFDEDDYDDYDEEEEKSPLERAQKAHHLWGGTPLGLNSNIRVYRYSPGQFFAQHCGSTTFYPDATRANPHPEPISVAPETGLALLHRHGDKCMLHEGGEVVSGEKWVLRSDLVVAR